MENVADALKIAFAIFVFVTAITIIFVMVGKVKSTSDVVLYYSDKTNFYEHYKDTSKDLKGNRIVGVSDIVATLYRYYTESVAVTIKINDNTYYFDVGNETLMDEETKSGVATVKGKEENLGKFITNILLEKYSNSNFIEEFSEAPTSGIYSTGEDGSEITLSSGGKKVYVTYTKI